MWHENLAHFFPLTSRYIIFIKIWRTKNACVTKFLNVVYVFRQLHESDPVGFTCKLYQKPINWLRLFNKTCDKDITELIVS